jgi:hypothetical protein
LERDFVQNPLRFILMLKKGSNNLKADASNDNAWLDEKLKLLVSFKA